MVRLPFALLIALCALFTPVLAAQDPVPAPTDRLSVTAMQELSESQQLALIYSVGTPRLYQRLQAMLIEGEFERRKAAGLDVSFAEVTEIDVEQRIDRTIGDFVEQNPDLDFWAQVGAAGYTQESYRVEIRRNLELERLFFPPNTEDWPMDLLKPIFGGDEVESSLWNSMIKDMPAALATQREQGESGEINSMTMQMFLRPNVFRWLMNEAEILYPFDGLPSGVCLSVDGREVKSKDMIAEFASIVSDVDLDRALAWVDVSSKLEAALDASGHLLTKAETQAIMDEERKDFVNSYISYEQIALEFFGFPSLETFYQWKRLRESFRKTLPEEYDAEELDAHVAKRLHFFGSGEVRSEVILLSAKDLDTGSWPKVGSFEAARKRAEAVIAELLPTAGENWDEVLGQYSEYPSSVRGAAPGMPQPQRGRFGDTMRNPLRQFIGENEYTDFLTGVSIADDLFFEATPGAIYGPRESAYGVYIYKLIRRGEPKSQVDWRGDERQAYMVKDDYLSVKFLEYIQSVMAR